MKASFKVNIELSDNGVWGSSVRPFYSSRARNMFMLDSKAIGWWTFVVPAWTCC